MIADLQKVFGMKNLPSMDWNERSVSEYLQSNGVRTGEYVQSGMEKSVQQPDVNSDDDFYSSCSNHLCWRHY